MYQAGKKQQMGFRLSESDKIEEIEELKKLVCESNGEAEIVKAGTLTALIENLTRHDRLDASFNRIFLTTYEYFTSTPALIDLLIRRFACPPPVTFNPTQVTEWSNGTKPLVQVRVINILKQWLEHFWTGPEGPNDPNLLKLQAFANGAVTETSAAQQLAELVQRRLAGLDSKRSHPSTPKPPKPILPRKLNKLEFIKIDAKEIARQLTIMEACMFSKLQTWHLVNVATECYNLRNYSAVISILSGLESAPIYRLARTWAMVTQRSCDALRPLQAMVSSAQNYNAYRETLRMTVPPCIPFLGLFLKDLTFIEDGNPSVTQEGLINFHKCTMLASSVHEIRRFQQAPYCLQMVPEIQEYLVTQLQSAPDVHDIRHAHLVNFRLSGFIPASLEMLLYKYGGKGSMRYVFIHGNHEIGPPSDQVTVEANIVVFTGLGNINGDCTQVDGQPNKFIPAREFTERLLTNVSIPTIIMGEFSTDQIGISPRPQDDYLYLTVVVYGRSDRPPCSLDDRVYLAKTVRGFVPYFVQSMSIRSDNYLPGDAQTLCRELTNYLKLKADNKEFNDFIELHRKRYFRNSSVQKEAILESCLLHILKMPFDLSSSIIHGLIRQ
ncbi:hypothetical protein PENARI_c003G11399 [Penicillium arizonense]|uniref:Ras-GEF domain-containing protein n=1 Tax=Penicillium arizonense TaxID=1835702 RepID=A0A1F5LTR7_PENAI|nr:hypothetical protein PENARI_c003G11399 [Penicillium arizonense]OGE56594.1 hypothetical protein PENARI_c003G11399 [Penicillium arizonense]